MQVAGYDAVNQLAGAGTPRLSVGAVYDVYDHAVVASKWEKRAVIDRAYSKASIFNRILWYSALECGYV